MAEQRIINVKYHFLHQEVGNDAIKFVWVPTKDQSADGLTKPLPPAAHSRFCELFGLVDCSSVIADDDGNQETS